MEVSYLLLVNSLFYLITLLSRKEFYQPGFCGNLYPLLSYNVI